jgi:hypothetical protein
LPKTKTTGKKKKKKKKDHKLPAMQAHIHDPYFLNSTTED